MREMPDRGRGYTLHIGDRSALSTRKRPVVFIYKEERSGLPIRKRGGVLWLPKIVQNALSSK